MIALTPPLERYVVTSPYGPRRDPIDGQLRFHDGVDLGAPLGTPVTAAAAGVVRRVGWDPDGWGRFVLVQTMVGHELHLYAHLQDACVDVGDLVWRREQLGTVGSTGRSTGPHLHFGVYRAGTLLR